MSVGRDDEERSSYVRARKPTDEGEAGAALVGGFNCLGSCFPGPRMLGRPHWVLAPEMSINGSLL